MNRVVIILVGGLVVIGAIAGLVYSTTRTEPVPTVSKVDSGNPEAASPAAAAPAANRSRPAAPAPAGGGDPVPASPAPKTDAAPITGTLVLESDTPDTTVFIDRKFLGTAPQTLRVAPGEHHLIFSPTGQDSIRMTVEVEPGTRTIVARFKEAQLSETVEVVHKHAFGSCRGTLKASPNGLTYDTKSTDDVFTVPLTNPDIFAVNYVEKNLKVKLKGGKTYTFAEPGGTADKLYAFHQAVDKARQRLLSGRRP